MNILIISFSSMAKLGGAETYNRTLVDIFKEDHKFYEIFWSKDGHSKDIYDIHVEKSIYIDNPFSKKKNILYKILNMKKYYNFMKNEIIKHVNMYNIDLIINSELFNFSSDEIGVPIIDVQHADDVFYKGLFYPNIITKFKRLISGREWNFNYFVGYSDLSIYNLFHNRNKKPQKMWQIPICKFKVSEIKKQKICPKERKKIVFIGRISKEKNINFLNDVSEELQKKGIKIDFYGDGPEMKNFYKYNNFHGSKNWNEIKNILSQTKILVLASKFEGFSVSVVDAISMGVPCIVYNSYTNAKYLIGENERGILVEKLDVDIFCDSILKLFYNSDYKNISKNCKQFAIQNLSLEKFKTKWSNIFQEVVTDEKNNNNSNNL